MIDQPPAPLPDTPPAAATQTPPSPSPGEQHRADGRLVIDLLQFVPPLPAPVCESDGPDPFNPEIVVCQTSEVSQRLGPLIGAVDEGFASAIPLARVKLSDTTAAEANATNPSVGGWNAQGAELRLKVDF